MKNTQELREFLIREMKETAAGRKDVKVAKATCNFAQQIYNTMNIELKVEKMRKAAINQPVQPIVFPKGDSHE